MKFPAWAGLLIRSLRSLGWPVALVLGNGRQLEVLGGGHDVRGAGDVRARLSRESRVRVGRFLELLLVRARLRKGRARLSLLRSLPLLAPARDQAVYMAQRASRFDEEFRSIIARADEARDRHKWAEGIAAYTQALSLYEGHAGYLVQRSHCYKEMRAYREAELGYRDALALGVPVDHVWPHLAHVVQRQGGAVRLYPDDVVTVLEASDDRAVRREGMVTSRELTDLAWLLLGMETPESDWMLAMMRASPMRVAMIERLLAEPAFFSANRALVGLAGREGGLS